MHNDRVKSTRAPSSTVGADSYPYGTAYYKGVNADAVTKLLESGSQSDVDSLYVCVPDESTLYSDTKYFLSTMFPQEPQEFDQFKETREDMLRL